MVVGISVIANRGPDVDLSARPARDIPGPVLLVPGYGGSRGSLLALAGRIDAAGRPAAVHDLVGDGTGVLSAQVRALDDADDDALATGAPSVDVIGYSAGGVVVGLWVVRDDGARSPPDRHPRLAARRRTLAAAGAVTAPDAAPSPAGSWPRAVRCWPSWPGSRRRAAVAIGLDRGRRDRHPTPPGSAGRSTCRSIGSVPVLWQFRLPADPVVVGLVLRAISADPLSAGGECATLHAPCL